MVANGIDRISRANDYEALFRGKRIGLITSPSGLSGSFESTIEILHKRYGLAALFSPEHGVRGDREAGGPVDTYIDGETGVPVYSLYRNDSKRLTDEMLDAVDVIIYDMQDIGARYYTFIYTMLYALQDCAKAGKKFVILDRINPLDGVTVEGNRLKDGFRSFVGDYPLCMRYGLTVGELAAMANRRQKLNCDLHVVPCAGWDRTMLFPETGRVWIMPSMGIPRFETALLYAGMCLFEGTNVSEGRGTTCPFEIIGAPYIDAKSLALAMNRKKLPGLYFRPVYFTPVASKHRGDQCSGVFIHVTDMHRVRAVDAAVELMGEIRRTYSEFVILPPGKEGARPMMDLLSGDDALRLNGREPEHILEYFHTDSESFAQEKQEFHLYR